MPISPSALEARVRRAATRRGHRVHKIRPTSRWFHQYGPYLLSNPLTNSVIGHGYQLDDLASVLEVAAED